MPGDRNSRLGGSSRGTRICACALLLYVRVSFTFTQYTYVRWNANYQILLVVSALEETLHHCCDGQIANFWFVYATDQQIVLRNVDIQCRFTDYEVHSPKPSSRFLADFTLQASRFSQTLHGKCDTRCYKPKGRRFETRWSENIFSVYRILLATLGLRLYSVSYRND
jgi:hypothetical protein